MIFFTFLVIGLSAFNGAFAVSSTEFTKRGPTELVARQSLTSTANGTNNGYYYSFWTNGEGFVTYTNGDAGAYNLEWADANDFFGGKGWNPGGNRTFNYSGDFNTNGYGYLALYGWTEDPIVEYSIVESYGKDPSIGASHLGSVESDGGTYNIYEDQRVNFSISGTTTFKQYWSVRTSNRTSGTVTTSNHFAAWESLGLKLGVFQYMILATVGYESSGSSSITLY